jgi:hypothetical protein
MREAFILSIALGLALATPVAANSLDKVSLRESDPRTIHHKANFAKATALANPLSAVAMSSPLSPETDGLSRNDEDCKYGCIDH